MRKILLTTVAVAAVVGYTAMAAAQNTDSKGAAGGQQEQKAAPGGAGGAMAHPQRAAQPKTMSPSAHSAQGPARGAKQNERIGQSQDQKETKTPQRGAQKDQPGTAQKGAQEERGMPQKSAQDEHGTDKHGAAAETPKSGANAPAQHADQGKAGRGASVQLSQTQRSRIGAIIGHNTTARAASNVHFDVAVGSVVPHDVKIEVLPENVVEIVPEYQGYDYIIVGDNILIIDPDTLQIVAVIPV